MTGWRVVADVGGTNVRFARARAGNTIEHVRAWPNASFPSFIEALSRYVNETGGLAGCAGIAVAAAGPVADGTVRLTNGEWVISGKAISDHANGLPARVINDLEAVAYAIPHLAHDDVAAIGSANAAVSGGVKIAVNVGTGFGASIVLPAGAEWTAIACEPGHMSLALDDRERRLVGNARSIEDVLSGPGMQAIGRKLSAASGHADPSSKEGPAPGGDIFASGGGANRELVELFSGLLGQVCGDLVLATGAWGGVYTCGGLASAWFQHALHAQFRQRFEDKGPMAPRMRDVFTGHITNRLAALNGLATLRLE